jgi:hypothetical protein
MNMDIDITTKVQFGDNDGEVLPLSRCVCGKRFDPWTFILSVYREDPKECTCGRKLYFKNVISIFEVVTEVVPCGKLMVDE